MRCVVWWSWIVVVCIMAGSGGWGKAAQADVGASASAPLVVSHRARVVLDPAAHTLVVSDTLQVPTGIDSIGLHAGLLLTDLGLLVSGDDGEPRVMPLVTVSRLDTTGQFVAAYYTINPDKTEALASGGNDAARTVVISYEGSFFQPVDEVTFSRERVGGEIQATISDEGIYLASGALWLPFCGDGVLATHRLLIDTPAGIEPVTQGVRILSKEAGDRLLTIWDAVHPSDGLNLVANRFIIDEQAVGEVTIATYLLEEDPRLRDLYLERTRTYLEMYEEMIGPYPYGKFATVENWFPTGYGMPSYTLLGGVVLRLPFIPYTSFGHEICHNWWGNSVFVDVANGNWCEGLTVYCADYHYKELESPAAAREYRRNLLKDYAAYVRGGNDFPLVAFESRHSGATRAVGYGKSMMVFHMVDRLIGREAFLAALGQVYKEKLFQKASWSDFFAAFATTASRDLTRMQEQWLNLAGAPELVLDQARRKGDRVLLELSQDEPVYELQVPVVVSTAAGEQEHVVELDGLRGEFELQVPGATAVAIDPDYHLFRRLDPVEIEPTLNQVLGEEAPLFVVSEPAATTAEREFATGFSENETPDILAGARPPRGGETDGDRSCILLNPTDQVLPEWSPPELTVASGYAFLAGMRYSLKEYDLVYTTAKPGASALTDLVIVCQDPTRLTSLAGRLGHYGKYSWLLFPVGPGQTLRGNWSPPASPLAVTFSD